MYKNIIITGASSGLGAALALEYADTGVTLGLIGRDRERLKKVAEQCEAKGAVVKIGIMDVRDDEIISEWLEEFDNTHPVDLIIPNAGISAGAGGSLDKQKLLREVFAINVNGTLNSIMPVIPRMQQRKSGQIAIMSSLAGLRGLPSCPAYSASKAAVRFFGEGLRGELAQDGISVCVICPGYIDTPMTQDNDFYMPFLMSPEKAARKIRKGLSLNRSRIAFPLALYIPLWLLACLPNRWTDGFFARLPKK